MTPSPEITILRHLAARTTASATKIGTACAISPGEVRDRLVMLESMRLVAGRRDPDASPTAPRRVSTITGEERPKAGISDARATV